MRATAFVLWRGIARANDSSLACLARKDISGYLIGFWQDTHRQTHEACTSGVPAYTRPLAIIGLGSHAGRVWPSVRMEEQPSGYYP